MKNPNPQPEEQKQEENAREAGSSKIIVPSAKDTLKKSPEELSRWFKNQIGTFAEEMERTRTFILALETFEGLMEQYGGYDIASLPETIRIFRELLYEGKSPRASGCRISLATLRAWPRKMGMAFDKYEGMEHYRRMNLNTIWRTGLLHQFACQTGVDLKDFPIKIL